MTAAPGSLALAPTGDPVHPDAPSPAGGAAHWYPAEGLRHRGTLVLLPGRGEHPGVYERFGRRLAGDAYVVHVLPAEPGREPAEVAASVDTLAADATAPLVLAGSDTGALLALAASIRTLAAPAALLLAGVPRLSAPEPGTGSGAAAGPVTGSAIGATSGSGAGAGPEDDGQWPSGADELAARTACPAHRGRLLADPLFAPGALAVPVPAALAAAAEAALAVLPDLPVLLLHGAADPVTPLPSARALAALLPASTTFATVIDGLHDTLNDINHRTVAALTTQWLERLRSPAGPGPIVTVEGVPVP